MILFYFSTFPVNTDDLYMICLTFQISNIIYLDSPAGVGFSYSENKTEYKTGDLKTASDSHAFILKVKQSNHLEN